VAEGGEDDGAEGVGRGQEGRARDEEEEVEQQQRGEPWRLGSYWGRSRGRRRRTRAGGGGPGPSVTAAVFHGLATAVGQIKRERGRVLTLLLALVGRRRKVTVPVGLRLISVEFRA
jgi:hypothetical protein